MARPRTATNILKARGAFLNHPERKHDREFEPQPNQKFPTDPPNCLSQIEAATWREIVARVPAGILGDSDVFTVEVAARLLAELRETGRAMSSARLLRLTSELGKLGLSPSDRAKLKVDKGKAGKFSDL